VVSVFVFLAVACGGATGSDLFSGNGADSGGTGDDAMSGQDSAMPAPGDAAAQDTTTAMDTSTAPPPDVYTAPEASPMDDAPSGTFNITCGATTCTGPAELCCVSGPQGAQTDMCVAGTGAGASNCNAQTDTPVRCTSSAQCPGGQLCCGRVVNSVYGEISCRMTCGAAGEFQFCDPNVPSDCPPTTTCTPSTVLDGFNRCN
jgi:hypothetical protein